MCRGVHSSTPRNLSSAVQCSSVQLTQEQLIMGMQQQVCVCVCARAYVFMYTCTFACVFVYVQAHHLKMT